MGDLNRMEGEVDGTIAANLRAVRARIDAACGRAGREPSSVTLCAVSKRKPEEDIRAALAAGQHVFGENYVQELCGKAQDLQGEPLEWHMIGHLQRNKVKNIIDIASLIHSVDSLRLAQQIEKDAAAAGRRIDVLLEVNAAGEESKFGFAPEEVPEAARAIGALEHVCVKGLMTSAPITDDPETNRPYFKVMRTLLEELQRREDPGVDAQILSMGMTGDFEVAVEEGATIVRIGTAIFGER